MARRTYVQHWKCNKIRINEAIRQTLPLSHCHLQDLNRGVQYSRPRQSDTIARLCRLLRGSAAVEVNQRLAGHVLVQDWKVSAEAVAQQ